LWFISNAFYGNIRIGLLAKTVSSMDLSFCLLIDTKNTLNLAASFNLLKETPFGVNIIEARL